MEVEINKPMKARYVNPFTDFGFKEKAEIANYSTEERDEYEQSLKAYRDLKGVIDNAFDEGIEKGKIEGKIEGKYEVAKSMKLAGEPIAKIMLYTGLSEEEINEL